MHPYGTLLDVLQSGVHAQFSRFPEDGAPNYAWRTAYCVPYDTEPLQVFDYVLSTSSWNHIVVSYDNASIGLWLNGAFVGTTTNVLGIFQNLDPQSTPNPLTIGRRDHPLGDAYSDYLRGRIDEVRIYNRALSSNEALELYQLEAYDGTPGSLLYGR